MVSRFFVGLDSLRYNVPSLWFFRTDIRILHFGFLIYILWYLSRYFIYKKIKNFCSLFSVTKKHNVCKKNQDGLFIFKDDLEWRISSTFELGARGSGFDSHPGDFGKLSTPFFLTMENKACSYNVLVTCNIRCLLSQIPKIYI